MPINPKKIEEWETLAKAATPGPWRKARGHEEAWTLPNGAKDWEGGWVFGAGVVEVMGYKGCGSHDIQWSDADRALVLAARAAVPALLAEREEMLALLREVEWGGTDEPSSEGPGGRYCPHPKCIGPEPWHDVACPLGIFLGTAPMCRCGQMRGEAHAHDCRLAALLGKGD